MPNDDDDGSLHTFGIAAICTATKITSWTSMIMNCWRLFKNEILFAHLV